MTKIFLAGDYIIDEYIFVEPKRLSPEAPILIVGKSDSYCKPGGAANVRNNLESLGMEVDFYWGSSNSTKTRIVAGNQQLIRMDNDNTTQQKLPSDLKDRINDADVIMISDYDKGVIDNRLLSLLEGLRDKKILIDPYVNKYYYGDNVTLMTPNRQEVESIVGFRIKDSRSLKRAAELYMTKTLSRNLLITLGKDGMAFFDREKYKDSSFIVDAKNGNTTDVTGAGDVVFAVMGYIWSHPHFSKRAAVEYANKAGGISVSRFGCATLKKDEIFEKNSIC